jgi:hypothetical protein
MQLLGARQRQGRKSGRASGWWADGVVAPSGPWEIWQLAAPARAARRRSGGLVRDAPGGKRTHCTSLLSSRKGRNISAVRQCACADRKNTLSCTAPRLKEKAIHFTSILKPSLPVSPVLLLTGESTAGRTAWGDLDRTCGARDPVPR